MTTARITSLEPQVYQATLHAAKQVIAEDRDSARQSAETQRAAPVKPAGLGAVIDILV